MFNIDIQLTNDADKALCLIYKKYLSDVKNGVSKTIANRFDTHNIESDFPKVNRTDFRDTLDELKDNELIEMNIIGIYSLTTDGIIYMENRFKNGLNEVIDFISKLIP